MKLNPELDLSDPSRPAFIVTTNAQEERDILDREKRGELKIEWCEIVPRFNSHWRYKVRYPLD